MREKVGVRAQLVNVKPVLFTVGQTPPDERLGLSAGLWFCRKLDLRGFENGVLL